MSRRAVAGDKQSEPSPLSAPIDRTGLQHIGELLPAVLQAIAEQAYKCTYYEDRDLRRAA